MFDPGTELDGRYKIVRLLGEGAMGAVYEAVRTAVGRKVAVKVLHAHFSRVPEAVQRFEREARAAAAIGHPNIVEVLDTGVHQSQPFFVMELLRGETLGERLANGDSIPVDVSCEIMGHILSALASAHAKGIVHRDLKPDNVFLVEEGGDITVKLLDFGVSKFKRDGAVHSTTLEGLPVGTPAYMAPEQWMGRRDIDHRADLFAAAVILYELLTGGMPYEGASQGELFLEIVRGTEAPPSPSSIAPGIPEALDPIVLRGLHREREQRYPSAQRFLEALRPFGASRVSIVDLPPAKIPEEHSLSSFVRRPQRVAETLTPRPDTFSFSRAAALIGSVAALLVGVSFTALRFQSARPIAAASLAANAPALAHARLADSKPQSPSPEPPAASSAPPVPAVRPSPPEPVPSAPIAAVARPHGHGHGHGHTPEGSPDAHVQGHHRHHRNDRDGGGRLQESGTLRISREF